MKTTHFFLVFCLFAALYLFGWRENRNSYRPKGRILQSNGDLSFPSSSFFIEDHLDIYFEIDSTDITMLIKCITPGRYFSIGFGSTRMAGSDMWVFTISDGEILAEDHYGTGWGFPPRDTGNGGANDLEVLGYEITSSYSLVKVKRKLNTGDPNDYIITEGIPVDIIYATGPSHSMVNHGPSRGHVQLSLINGIEGLVLEDIKKFGPIDLHGIFNIIAWGLLVDIAILVARYLRGSKFTIWRIVITAHGIHSALMWLAFILSTIVTITLLNRKESDGLTLNGEAKHDFHVINGIVILALSSLAVGIGGFNFYLMRIYKNTVSAKTILYLRRIHLALGFLLYLLTKVNIIVGVIIYDQGSWKTPVLIYLGVLLFVHILFQFKMFTGFTFTKKISNSSLLPKCSQNPKHVNLLKAINNGTPIDEILSEFPNIKWVQLGNNVYDLTNWVHPGGNFIIEACIGREVGRYLYGNYALENSNVKPYKHSDLALSQMKKFYIGEVTNSESILLHKDTKGEAQATSDHIWKITSVKPVSKTTSQITFTSEHFNVKTFGSSLSFLGRHFKVSFNYKDAIARQYTTAQALTDINTQFRQNAYEYFTSIMNDQDQEQRSDPKLKIDDLFQTVTDSLPLFIKNYPFPNALSRALHEVDIKGDNNELIVEGPIGRGLDLTPSSTGTHTIICAGTGVLPFIDFLNFFLFKTMYQALKDKAGVEKAEEINVFKTSFDDVMEGLKLNFVGSFDNENEVIGLDILQKLAEISRRYKINNFTAMVKGYGDENIVEVKEFFSRAFFEKNVTLTGEKYYVVGPPKLNAMVSKDLASLGVAKDKIILV